MTAGKRSHYRLELGSHICHLHSQLNRLSVHREHIHCKRNNSLPEIDGRSEGFNLLTCRRKTISYTCTSHNAHHIIVTLRQQRKIKHGESLATEISKGEITPAEDVAQYRHSEYGEGMKSQKKPPAFKLDIFRAKKSTDAPLSKAINYDEYFRPSSTRPILSF